MFVSSAALMASALETLLGAAFEGHLAPADGTKCSVKYVLGRTTHQPVPPAVRKQRRDIGWNCSEAVVSVDATCSIPSFGLRNEAVTVSFDPPDQTGSRLLLLQSLTRPELGVTILVLSGDGQSLNGGDETWSIGDPPVIQTKRVIPSIGKTSEVGDAIKPNVASVMEESVKPAAQEAHMTNPTEKGTIPTKAAVRTPIGYRDDPDVMRDSDVGAWRHLEEAGPHAPVIGGVGRSVMGAAAEKRHAPSQVSSLEADLVQRPESVISTQSGPSDEAILAAKVETQTRVLAAASAGELGDLKMFGARVGFNAVATRGMTPLMAAAERGRLDCVEFLLEQRVDLEVADPQGWTALMHATHNQRIEALRLLLEARASTSSSSIDEGNSALHLAAMVARPEPTTLLLQSIPKLNRDAKNADGRTAVHIAAKNGRNGCLMTLLEAKCKANACDNEGFTPLLLAADSGRPESIRILLRNRADLNAKSAIGRSAVEMARMWSHDRVLEVLAEAGA